MIRRDLADGIRRRRVTLKLVASGTIKLAPGKCVKPAIPRIMSILQKPASNRTTNLLLVAITILLGILAIRPYIEPSRIVQAEARFDHVNVLSTGWIRNGRPGILLMDRRNGNVWYMGTQTEKGPGLSEPQFVLRVPFEKLDQAPAGQ